MTYNEARQHARQMVQTADGREFLKFLTGNLCGVGNPISAVTPEDTLKAVGAYNVGVEIVEMTKEMDE